MSACRDCMFSHRRDDGLLDCRFNPTAVKVREDWWCHQFAARREQLGFGNHQLSLVIGDTGVHETAVSGGIDQAHDDPAPKRPPRRRPKGGYRPA